MLNVAFQLSFASVKVFFPDKSRLNYPVPAISKCSLHSNKMNSRKAVFFVAPAFRDLAKAFSPCHVLTMVAMAAGAVFSASNVFHRCMP